MKAVLNFLATYHYLWWIPLVIGWYSLYYWASHYANLTKEWRWVAAVWAIGAFGQWWAIVALVSRNLLFDGMLYDSIIVVLFPVFLILTGHASGWQWWQFIGAGITVIGLIMMQINQEMVKKLTEVMVK